MTISSFQLMLNLLWYLKHLKSACSLCRLYPASIPAKRACKESSAFNIIVRQFTTFQKSLCPSILHQMNKNSYSDVHQLLLSSKYIHFQNFDLGIFQMG